MWKLLRHIFSGQLEEARKDYDELWKICSKLNDQEILREVLKLCCFNRKTYLIHINSTYCYVTTDHQINGKTLQIRSNLKILDDKERLRIESS